MRTNHLYWLFFVVVSIAGCGGPAHVSPANLRLIDGLRTAASSKQIQWVEQSAKLVEEGKRKGTVSDQEYEEFESIIRLAREGKWKEAEAESIRLGKAQKPTAEEIEKAKKRQPPAG